MLRTSAGASIPRRSAAAWGREDALKGPARREAAGVFEALAEKIVEETISGR